MIRRLKDSALTKGVKMALNRQMKEYGEVLKLELNSKEKRIELEVILEGEREPLCVTVDRYVLSEEEGRHHLRLYGVSTSRAWINTLARSYLEGRAFEIPAEYAKLLKMVV